MVYQIHTDLRSKQKVLSIIFSSQWMLGVCYPYKSLRPIFSFRLPAFYLYLVSSDFMTLCYYSLVLLTPGSPPNHLAHCGSRNPNSCVHRVTSRLWNQGQLPTNLSVDLQEPKWARTSRPCTTWPGVPPHSSSRGMVSTIGFASSPFLQAIRQSPVRTQDLNHLPPAASTTSSNFAPGYIHCSPPAPIYLKSPNTVLYHVSVTL